MTPRFSIVIPSYNRGYILWKAIQSVQDQSFEDWELIVVDDGSTDDTAKVGAQFQDDPRIKYVQQSNAGAAAARNRGMAEATGEIIGYLDSDDVLYPKCIELMDQAFRTNRNAVFVIPNFDFSIEFYDEAGKLLGRKREGQRKPDITLKEIVQWKESSAYGTGLFHLRSAMESGIAWDPKLISFDDWDFVIQLARKFPDGFVRIPTSLYRYAQRYGGDGLCSNAKDYSHWAVAFEAIWRKHKDHPLMVDQDFYPAKVEKYKKRQKEFEAGRLPPPAYKYFPEFYRSARIRPTKSNRQSDYISRTPQGAAGMAK